MNNPLDSDNNYIDFVIEIKDRIHRSQLNAFRAVNKALIQLYWDIGRIIVDKQHGLGWGKSVVEQLSKDIQKACPGIQRFSARNLWNIRNSAE